MLSDGAGYSHAVCIWDWMGPLEVYIVFPTIVHFLFFGAVIFFAPTQSIRDEFADELHSSRVKPSIFLCRIEGGSSMLRSA